MKGKYINTVIMMAVLAGKRSRRIAKEKETLNSLNNHKVIWSKNGPAETTANQKPATALL